MNQNSQSQFSDKSNVLKKALQHIHNFGNIPYNLYLLYMYEKRI